MKFNYEYRTAKNERRSGVIAASTREAAFAELKAHGIKPARLVETPGFFNLLFGKGKRWIAIVCLAAVAIALAGLFSRTSKELDALTSQQNVAPRAQLYGDPVVIGEAMRMGWFNEFGNNVGERHLARHAIPGRECGCGNSLNESTKKRIGESILKHVNEHVAISETDLAEAVTMKRMVNGMKDEAAAYVRAGGSILKYLDRLEIRQRAELAVYEQLRREIQNAKDESVRKAKNAELRARGLPMVDEAE